MKISKEILFMIRQEQTLNKASEMSSCREILNTKRKKLRKIKLWWVWHWPIPQITRRQMTISNKNQRNWILTETLHSTIWRWRQTTVWNRTHLKETEFTRSSRRILILNNTLKTLKETMHMKRRVLQLILLKRTLKLISHLVIHNMLPESIRNNFRLMRIGINNIMTKVFIRVNCIMILWQRDLSSMLAKTLLRPILRLKKRLSFWIWTLSSLKVKRLIVLTTSHLKRWNLSKIKSWWRENSRSKKRVTLQTFSRVWFLSLPNLFTRISVSETCLFSQWMVARITLWEKLLLSTKPFLKVWIQSISDICMKNKV